MVSRGNNTNTANISGIKAFFWFYCKGSAILVPIVSVIGGIAAILMPSNEKVDIGAIASIIFGAVIGYLILFFGARLIYKSEEKMCNSDETHMREFKRTGIKNFLIFLSVIAAFTVLPAFLVGAAFAVPLIIVIVVVVVLVVLVISRSNQ